MSRLTAYVLACTLALAGLAAFGTAADAITAPTADRIVTLRITPSSPYSGSKVSVVGQISPVASGTVVWLQQEQKPGMWKTVKIVRTNSAGTYAWKPKVSAKGVRHYRAHLLGSATGPATSSATRSITVVAKPSKTYKTVRPTVSGVPQIGHTLTVKTGKWSPKPSKFTYRWRRDGAKISGATKSKYVLTRSDLGTYVTVEVTASRKKGQHTIRESTTNSVIRPDTFVAATPTITGSRDVGDTLTANTGGWSPAPEAFTYQWSRDQQPIAGATSSTYTTTTQDAGDDLAVTVVAHRSYFSPRSASSAPVEVTTPDPEVPPVTPPPPPASKFSELMDPESTTVLPKADATVTFSDHEPSWFPNNHEVRWDTPGAFAHSLDPVAYGTLFTARMTAENGTDYREPWVGAEYHVDNSMLKNADVRFTVTGKKFAIRYWTIKQSDAMVWINDQPVASHAFAGSDPSARGSWNWLVVTRSSGAPATVRFAGPMYFTGVDSDPRDDVTVTAAPQFTLGVISDSDFEPMPDTHPMTQAAAPMLSTLTGFRVWNMAEGGTGYINPGAGGYPGNETSPYGSDRRIATITAAPINALLVNGSINDLNWGADAQRDAMDAFLDRVAAARPDLPVVLVGIEPLSYSTVRDQSDPRFQAMDANFAVVAARHSNVVGVIDPYAADWLTGTGSTASPAGDGNQDQYVGIDGVHLNAEGQAYYQGRIADELRPMLLHPTEPTP